MSNTNPEETAKTENHLFKEELGTISELVHERMLIFFVGVKNGNDRPRVEATSTRKEKEEEDWLLFFILHLLCSSLTIEGWFRKK